jgi:hypothetical protein
VALATYPHLAPRLINGRAVLSHQTLCFHLLLQGNLYLQRERGHKYTYVSSPTDIIGHILPYNQLVQSVLLERDSYLPVRPCVVENRVIKIIGVMEEIGHIFTAIAEVVK